MVLAFAQRQAHATVVIGSDIVEADGAKTLTHKKTGNIRHLKRQRRFPIQADVQSSKKTQVKKKNVKPKRGSERKVVHHGRALVVAGRNSHACVWQPLRPKSSKRGASSPGESTKEVLDVLKRHVIGKSSLSASDAGPGLLSAFQKHSMPIAPARHSLDEVTPVKSVVTKSLTPRQKLTVNKFKVNKKPAVQSTPAGRVVKVVGGDNKCESAISAVKRTLRRQQLLGRSSPLSVHVDTLQALELQERPGLANALRAFALFRSARCGQVGHDPRKYLELASDKDWLYDAQV